MAKWFGNRREAPPPALRAVSPLRKDPAGKTGWIDVTFVHAVGGLRAAGLPLGFVVLDAEGKPAPALFKTTLHGSTARLHVAAEFFAADLRVAYGHGNAPACNIADGRDCAIPVFASQKPGTETKLRRRRADSLGRPGVFPGGRGLDAGVWAPGSGGLRRCRRAG